MSTVRSPRPLSHWHFGFYNPHAVGAGRLAPLSHDSLVATSRSLINFSSRVFSRRVHVDITLVGSWPWFGPISRLSQVGITYHMLTSFAIVAMCGFGVGGVRDSIARLSVAGRPVSFYRIH